MNEVATATGNAKRRAMASWRKDLASGGVTLEDALNERPECFADWSVLDFLRLGPRWGRRRVAVLNQHAVECGVNLAEPMGTASDKTLKFAIRASQGTRGQGFASTFRAQIERHRAQELDRAKAEAKRLKKVIADHRRAMVDPQLDADVVKADARLWENGQ